MLAILGSPPNWQNYNISHYFTQEIKWFYDNHTLGGPSLLQFGPNNVTTPTKELIYN